MMTIPVTNELLMSIIGELYVKSLVLQHEVERLSQDEAEQEVSQETEAKEE